jgi:hypothetical protein
MRTLLFCLLLLALPGAALADGNVGVGVGTEKRGVISISGDGGNNEVEIRYNAENGTLVIEGKNGTLVRGETMIEIPLPDGPDKITAVVCSPGEGNDTVLVDLEGLPDGKRLEELQVEDTDQRDTGNDSVTVKNVSLTGRGRLKVGQEAGDDTTVVEDCDATNLNVDGGPGDDVTIRECNVRKRIKVDGDHENITIEDTFYPDLQIKDGTVPDTVQPSRRTIIERTTGKKVSFSGGSADNEVVFVDNVIESVSAKLGDGDDLISFTGTTADKVSIDGGPGALDCNESEDGNAFGSFKEKGFEPVACLGVELDFLPPGANPFLEPPEEAVAWKVTNGPHGDGPYALPGAENPLGLPVLAPDPLVPPAHWGQGPECVDGMAQLHHIHDDFDGHGDPDEEGCGHGVLSWGVLVDLP